MNRDQHPADTSHMSLMVAWGGANHIWILHNTEPESKRSLWPQAWCHLPVTRVRTCGLGWTFLRSECRCCWGPCLDTEQEAQSDRHHAHWLIACDVGGVRGVGCTVADSWIRRERNKSGSVHLLPWVTRLKSPWEPVTPGCLMEETVSLDCCLQKAPGSLVVTSLASSSLLQRESTVQRPSWS